MPLLAKAAAKTDVGLVRRSNQDSFGLDESLGVYVVCDGMGGAVGGETASNLAVQSFLQTAKQELTARGTHNDERMKNALTRAAVAANRAVRMRAKYDPRLEGMGTTLVGACVEGGTITLVNVGDSRAYMVREGEAWQMTMDHSYVAESVRRGVMTLEEAAASPMHSVITRAIGAEDDVEVDIFTEELRDGDAILLASDGLTRHVTDEGIAEVIGKPERSAVECCRQLIEAAKNDGGSDNVTCLVVRICEESHASSSAGMRRFL